MQFYWIRLVSSVSKIFMKRILCQSICPWNVTEESTVVADYQYRVVNYCSLDWQAAIDTSSRCDHYEILKSPHNVEKENRGCNVCQHLYVWSRILYNEFIYVPGIYTKTPQYFYALLSTQNHGFVKTVSNYIFNLWMQVIALNWSHSKTTTFLH